MSNWADKWFPRPFPWGRPAFLDEPEYARERQEADKEWEREQAEDERVYYEPKEPTDG